MDMVAPQLVGQAVGTDAGAGEYQDLAQLASLDEVGEQLAFFLPRHRMQHVSDELGRRIAGRDLELGRIAQQSLGEGADLIGERGREEQVLPLRRQQGDDALDVGQESHVQHAVRLIEHQGRYLVEHDRFVLRVVEEPSRSRHEYLHPFAQLRDLRVHVDAAVNHRAAQWEVFAVFGKALGNLDGKLARGRENQRAHRVARRRCRAAGLRGEALQDRQRKRRGLSGPRLRACHEIASGKHQGNGLLLHRCRLLVAELADRRGERRDQAELVEGRTN